MKTARKTFIVSYVILGTIMLWTVTFAYQWWQEPSSITSQEDQTKKTEITQIIENKDYAGFQKIFSGTNLLTKIDTQAKFEQRVALENYIKVGNRTWANEIKNQLWLNWRLNSQKNGWKMMNAKPKWVDKVILEQIITDKDYLWFQKLFSGKNLLTKIDTQAKFEQRAQMNIAMKAGDLTGANNIRISLGLWQAKIMHQERIERKMKWGMKGWKLRVESWKMRDRN